MNLVQKEYNLIKEGKGSKAHFLKLAKMNFPKHIGTTNTFDQAVTILTGKSLLSEGIGGYVDLQPNTTKSWFNIFEAMIIKILKILIIYMVKHSYQDITLKWKILKMLKKQ